MSKLEPFKKHLGEFLTSVRYKESFVQRLAENLATTRVILDKEPCLIKDFQVLLDNKGNVYHLDFDRCFMPDDASKKYTIPEEDAASCLHVLRSIERKVQEKINY